MNRTLPHGLADSQADDTRLSSNPRINSVDPAVASYARHQMPPKINNQIVKEQDAEWSRHYCHRHSDANQRGSHSRRTCPLFVCVCSPLKLNFTLAALSLPCQPLPISFTLGLFLSHLRASFILAMGRCQTTPTPLHAAFFSITCSTSANTISISAN